MTTLDFRLRTFVALFASAILATFVLPTQADEGAPVAAVGEPTQVIDTLHENLLRVMKNAATLRYEGPDGTGVITDHAPHGASLPTSGWP